MRSLAECNSLLRHLHSTDNDTRLQSNRTTQSVELIVNLVRELSCRRQDEGEEGLRVFPECLQNGQSESDRLSGASLGETDYVLALECMRDGFRLNACWLRVSEFGTGGTKLRADAELCKGARSRFFLLLLRLLAFRLGFVACGGSVLVGTCVLFLSCSTFLSNFSLGLFITDFLVVDLRP